MTTATKEIPTVRTKKNIGQEFDPSGYPMGYAAELLRAVPDHTALPASRDSGNNTVGVFLRRPSAVAMVRLFARVMELDVHEVATRMADEYLRQISVAK